MKILCTGDLHLGSLRRRIASDKVYSGDAKVLDGIVSLANEERVDGIFILGDLFDSADVNQAL